MTWTNIIGRKFPSFIKPLIKKSLYRLIPLKKRMGKDYWQLKSFLEKAQWWERERIEAWQLDQIQRIIKFAYEQTNGYRLLFNEAGVTPADIQSLDDIKYFPLTTKELIRDNADDFMAKSIPNWQKFYVTTGGSSGNPLGFFKTKDNLWVSNAFCHMDWEWVGWHFGERSSVLSRPIQGPINRLSDYDPIRKELVLNSFKLSNENYPKYRRALLRYKPTTLQAYPSTATQLASLILDKGDKNLFKFTAILLSSENIHEWQLEIIKSAFPGSRVVCDYGSTEQVCFGAWCETVDEYHIWPFIGYTELIDPKQNNLFSTNIKEIVATSFWNKATPFIRYQTNDLAVYKSDHCEGCGRHFDVFSKIEGRKGDFFVGRDRNLISLTALIYGQHFKAFKNIMNMQFVQKTPGIILVKIEPGEAYTPENSKEIKSSLESAADGQLIVELILVNQIEKTARGKNKVFDQQLDITQFI